MIYRGSLEGYPELQTEVPLYDIVYRYVFWKYVNHSLLDQAAFAEDSPWGCLVEFTD